MLADGEWDSLDSSEVEIPQETPCASKQTMLAHLRCKSAMALSLFVLVVHLLLILSLHGESLPPTALQNPAMAVGGEAGSHAASHGHRRSKRHVNSHEDTQGFYQSPHIPKDTKEPVHAPPTSDITNCRAGHIQGFSPVCDTHGCLRKLQLLEPNPLNVELPRNNAIPMEARQQISFIPGWLDNVHFSLVSRLTDMQWSYGIYGTVGEIGVVEGKFTSVLAFNVDHKSGERLFASDLFSSPAHSFPGRTQFEVFRQHMEIWGFDPVIDMGSPKKDDGEAKRVFVHLGTPYDLTKKLFVDLQLPQFRLLSVNGDQDAVAILASLEIGSCILREGGIVVLDGLDRAGSEILPALHHYFRKHGVATLMPMIAIKNKLYLTTTNWRDKYHQYFVTNPDILVKNDLLETQNDKFGETFTYYERR